MKEAIKTSPIKYKNIKEKMSSYSERLTAVLYQILFLAVSFVFARGNLLDKYLPFGISFVSAVPVLYLPSALFGSVMGYLFPATEFSGFRYIAAVITVTAIRLLVNKIAGIKNNPLFLSGVAFLSSLFTGLAVFKGIENSFFFCFSEALLCAGGTYFLNIGIKSLIKNEIGLSKEQLTAVVISCSLFFLGCYDFSVGIFSLGRILSVVFLLTASRYGGIFAGTFFGISLSLISALKGEPQSLYVALSFGGLLCGLFSEVGRTAEILSLLSAVVISIIFTELNAELAALTVQILISSALFLAVPKKTAIKIGRFFSPDVKVVKPTGLKKALTLRLGFAAEALADVSGTIDAVAKELSKINTPDFKQVLNGTEEDACKNCSLQIYCWETRYNETLSNVIMMTKGVKEGEATPENYCDEEFKNRCLRPQKMGAAVYKHYSRYASLLKAERRIDEVRSVVADQFTGISQMLKELSNEMGKDEKYDNATALKIASVLKNFNIIASEIGVRIDKRGRMNIEMKIENREETVINRAFVMKKLSALCDRDFDAPTLTYLKDGIFMNINEHAVYTANIGVKQINCNNNVISGDAYEYFFDGKGNLVLVLSDGMGTGGRAAVDGKLAAGLMSRLIKAGFDFNSALKILNSSMLFKSTDESLATVDIAKIDLYTGETELYKAGAAPSVVRRNGRAGKAQSTSLPVGILREVGFDKATLTLKDGDMIILMSDGATGEGVDWISAEAESLKGENAEAFATRIATKAQRRRSDNHEDDITVLCAIIKKA